MLLMNKSDNISEFERINRTAIPAHALESVFAFACYIYFAIRGDYGAGYMCIFALLAFAPVIGEVVFFRINHETTMVKHFLAMGFAVFYTFVLFTCKSPLSFTLVFPLMVIVSIFNDVPYILKIVSGAVLETIIVIIVGSSKGIWGYTNLGNAMLQLSTILLSMLFSVLATITLERNMKKRMKEVLESKKEAENSLDVVSKMSASLREGINNIYAELELLKEAAHNTNTTMEEVSLGAADTAQAVQSQIIQTEAIQNKVDDVDGAAENIAGNISHTLQIIDEADVQIKTLIESVDVSVENGSMAASRLEKLNSYIDEMNMIIELINSIADQTSLLALNANIEAARAGEVGKGFAVVANEISQMANQTSEATVQITQLIQNVGSAIKEVVDVIYTMIEGINDEKVATGNTAKGLSNISNDTHSIKHNVEALVNSIDELKDANSVIVDSIQTISAISQQVSAHAMETKEAEERNVEILGNVSDAMENLIKTAQ